MKFARVFTGRLASPFPGDGSSLPSPSSSRRPVWISLFCVSAIALGVGTWWLISFSAAEAVEQDAREVISVRMVPTRLVSAEDASAASTLRATATLEADREAALSFAVGGVVEELAADEGDWVRTGSLLAALDQVPFEAAVERAEARRRFLQSRVTRSEELFAANAISSEELEADRAELATLEAELRQLRWNLTRSSLSAPFEGRVQRRNVERGEVVGASKAAFVLIATDVLQARVAVPARELPRLDLNQPVELRFPDLSSLQCQGRIDHPPVSSDTRSGTVPLLVTIENSESDLLPGMLVEVEFALRRSEGGSGAEVRVPLSAVRVRDEGPIVFVVDSGITSATPVVLGAVRGEEVTIVSGLSPGQYVVDRAPDRLRDGDMVIATK